MNLLGVRDGVALRFTEEGALAAIETGRFGRSFEIHEDLGAKAGPLSQPLPYLPLESSLDMSDARFRLLDPYSGRQARQTLPGGNRTISILQGQTVLAIGPADALLARAHLDITLSAPLTWRLRLAGGAVWESDETGAEAYLERGCSVRVSSTSALAIEDDGHALSARFPAGSSTIEMWVEALPPLPVAPAIIVCSSTQVREAAIVASAVGSTDHAYVPILDLDLPPDNPEAIQEANNRLEEISAQLTQLEEKMNSVAEQGAQAAGGIVLPGARSAEQSIEQIDQQREKLLTEMEPHQQKVLAYTTWSRRATVLSRLVASMTSGSKESPLLVLLTPYPIELVETWAVTAETTAFFPHAAAQQVATWQASLKESSAGGRVETAFFSDARDLAIQVWSRVRAEGEPVFFTIPDEAPYYAVGLVDALRRGRALLPRGVAGAQVNLEAIQDSLNTGNTSDHAVIVEADGSVSSLVGALYAYHTGARLYVNPLPNFVQTFELLRDITENVQKEQLAAMAAQAYRYIGEHRKAFMQSQTADPQLKQIAAGLSILELPVVMPTPYSDQNFIQSLSTYLTAQQAGAQSGYRYDDAAWSKGILAALTAQATAAASEYVRKAVAGVSRLTIYTGGLPYSLTEGWQEKTIGLVLRDLAASLTLLDVARAGAGRASLPLALTIDPGLQQKPAPDVPALVDRTITLRGQNATLGNIALVSGLLPLDGVLLHTQGNLDTVILGDARNRLVEVHTSELAAQVRLNSSPLVIYAAPLAWLGLGITLMEQGACGYVGGLWPLNGNSAEEAVRLVLTTALVEGRNPAEALANLPGTGMREKQAFLYLGTATAWPAAENHLLEGAAVLYASAARLAASGRGPTATLVYDRLRAVTGDEAAHNAILRAELMLLDADYQVRLTNRNRERPAQDTIDKAWQSVELLDKMGLPKDTADELRLALTTRVAALELAAENFTRALELFESVRSARHAGGQTAAEVDAAYMVAMVQERQRQWAAARETLLAVQAKMAGMGNAIGLIMVTTGLAYVSLPLAMYPDVLGHLKVATQASLSLGSQVLSETLVQSLEICKAMAQMGAYDDVATIANTLAGVIGADTRLPEADRQAISAVLTLMEKTVKVLRAALPAQEREAQLATLVEEAQNSELARRLSMDSWILSAGAPPSADGLPKGQAGSKRPA